MKYLRNYTDLIHILTLARGLNASLCFFNSFIRPSTLADKTEGNIESLYLIDFGNVIDIKRSS